MTLGFWLGHQRSILLVDSISVLVLAAIVRQDRCSRSLLE
jgi:hypothetical protein